MHCLQKKVGFCYFFKKDCYRKFEKIDKNTLRTYVFLEDVFLFFK